MIKDFLITEEELRLRRKRLEATRNISSDVEILSETINEIDQVNLPKFLQKQNILQLIFIVNDDCESR
jgi:hypothetical protein